ncbi:MAG: ATP-binding protein [Chloroflexota bacterium]
MIDSLFPPSDSNITPREGLFPDRERYLSQILRSVHQGNCVRVLGPRSRGKSQILETAVSQLIEGQTHHAIYQSLKDLPMEQAFFTNLYRDVHLVNEADFFAGLFSRIQEKLEFRRRHARQTFPQTAFAFQNELLNLIRNSNRNIAIFIDDLETAPPNLVATLLGVLQSIFMTLVDEPGAHFQAVVCGSLSFSQLTLENASHFEAISDLVYVADLSLNDCEKLVESICYQADVSYESSTAPFLMTQTGGDANLITQILNLSIRQMGNADYTITPARLDEAIEAFLNEPLDKITQETIQQIQSDANLLSCALSLLEQGQMPNNQLPIPTNETPNPLDLCSAFLRFEGSYLIKCDIWQQLLIKHLDPAQIGGWYAVAGYWQESISYLGQAVADGKRQVLPELFAVIINAIHVSEESKQAYKYLGDGLQAAYPKTSIQLYRRDDQYLLPLYHSKEEFTTLQVVDPIPLNDLSRSEIRALDGPDYSLATVESETYLLIPLRTGQARSHPIGLVVLGGLFTIYSPYQHRKDVLRFVEFLKQAARALLRAELLKKDKEQQEILDRVAQITPKISEQLNLRAVYTAVLEQMMQYVPGADYGCIVEMDKERQILRIVSGQNSYPIDQLQNDDLSLISTQERRGIAGRTILEKRPYLINNVYHDPDYISAISTTKSQICVPIPIQNRVGAALVLESRATNAFTMSDQSLMEMVAKHAGIAIENARQFQDASNRQLRERTAMMATGLIHDINSAVATIPDLVDELQDFIEQGHDISKPLQDLEKSAMVTHRVSKRLRDFVVTGQHEIGWVELKTLIQHAIEISENNHPTPVKTILNMNGLNPQIQVDRLWIELLLRNLLTNAYESFEIEADKLITIDVGIDPSYYVINVQDNGKGIPQDIINDVFSLGFTTKNSNRMHGVGLFHCRMIAEVHDGELTVDSQLGEGTKFTLKLPR